MKESKRFREEQEEQLAREQEVISRFENVIDSNIFSGPQEREEIAQAERQRAQERREQHELEEREKAAQAEARARKEKDRDEQVLICTID